MTGPTTLVLDMAGADTQTAQAIATVEKLAAYLAQEAQAATTAAPPPDGKLKESDAWRLLGAQPQSSWESIELSRRRIVELAHPDRLAALGQSQQAKARAEAAQANAAYLFLHALRVGTG